MDSENKAHVLHSICQITNTKNGRITGEKFMISDINNVYAKTTDINSKLIHLYSQSALDRNKERNIQIEILDLIDETITLLNRTNRLNAWEKSKIVKAINAVNWNWLYLAIGRIQLAIIDPSVVSPENKYREEITRLNVDDLKKSVENMKSFILSQSS